MPFEYASNWGIFFGILNFEKIVSARMPYDRGCKWALLFFNLNQAIKPYLKIDFIPKPRLTAQLLGTHMN
jgi:hypothetical protein